MEMSPEKPASSKKPWLVGLGIGCGAIVVIVILLFIGGYYFVKNITRGFKDSEEISKALQAKYGKIEDFVPGCLGGRVPGTNRGVPEGPRGHGSGPGEA